MAWRKRPARPGAQRFFQTATLRKDLVVPVMRQTPRTIALAVAAALLAAAPAQAGEVILVDGDRAVRVNDPAVPTEREVSLGMPVGGPGPVGIAAARSDREARAARRARSAWRRARGAPPKKKKRADRRAVYAALERVQRRGAEEADVRRWRTWYVRSLRTYKGLRGARKDQLGYVIDSVEALALSKRLGVSRMPAAFVQLERNRRYWRSLPYPGAGDQVSFEGSQILYQYFPGKGLQLHPLATFKKANHMWGACQSGSAPCAQAGRPALPRPRDRGRRTGCTRASSLRHRCEPEAPAELPPSAAGR